VHPDLIAALAEDRPKSCPSGAVNRQAGGLCRECLTRTVWRRRIGQSARHAVRRRTNRRARGQVWIFAVATSVLRTFGGGVKR
jgi:hypothetical protein